MVDCHFMCDRMLCGIAQKCVEIDQKAVEMWTLKMMMEVMLSM